eukprot:scaffold7352_cov254-Pinguiococcus_pyrenoidosus.AAC.1
MELGSSVADRLPELETLLRCLKGNTNATLGRTHCHSVSDSVRFLHLGAAPRDTDLMTRALHMELHCRLVKMAGNPST